MDMLRPPNGLQTAPPVRAPQKQRKRKSLEKALAVASRKEIKVAKTSAKKDGKKGLKKLWTNDPKADT